MMHNYYTKASLWYVVLRFQTFCIQMTSCGPVTFLYLSTWSFTWKVVIFVTRPNDTGCLSKPKGPKMRKHSSLFSTQLYTTNVANLRNCCNITLTVMVAMQSDVRNSRRHVGTDCYSASKYWNCSVRLFCVTSRVLLSKEHKIDNRTCKF
jgi:hypothetical protein